MNFHTWYNSRDEYDSAELIEYFKFCKTFMPGFTSSNYVDLRKMKRFQKVIIKTSNSIRNIIVI